LENSAWYRDQVPTWIKRALIFGFVCVTWVFFRAESVADATLILQRIAQASFSDPQFPLLAAGLVGTVWIYQWWYESRWCESRAAGWLRIAAYVAMGAYLTLAAGKADQPFIYFQF
jgi:D-alanyl-lipoteichoic acid acyltransferase DltB (MBOAT superfamily)